MSNDKQIEEKAVEEMAKVIEITEQIARDAHCGLPSPRMYAKDLYWKGYRKQSEWISVDERLPDIDERCLLSMENRITKYRWVVIGYYHTNYDEYVTHWMPLPMPPKENKND